VVVLDTEIECQVQNFDVVDYQVEVEVGQWEFEIGLLVHSVLEIEMEGALKDSLPTCGFHLHNHDKCP